MTIALSKLEPVSERFLLVRMEPARYILPTLDASSIYQTTFNLPLSKLQRNGVDLTLVTTISNNDEYTFNETTGILRVKLASSPNDTSNILIAFYYLFYSGSKFRYFANQTPTDTTTVLREWKPRIENYPSFLFSFDEIIAGVFSINSTSLILLNSDKDFQQYLTIEDSFYNKNVDIWICINSTENILNAYRGHITSIKLNQNRVNLSIKDSFQLLQKPCYMGDTEAECYFRKENFADLEPTKEGLPIPFILGRLSRYRTIANNESVSGIPGYKILDHEGLYQAACTYYDVVVSDSTNRIWTLCRANSFGFASVSPYDSGAGVRSVDVGGYVYLYFTGLHSCYIGDTWLGHTHYGLVVHVGDFTYLGNTYNLIVKSTDAIVHTNNSYFTQHFAIIVRQDQVNYHIRATNGFTVSTTATTGGNLLSKITFLNGFETTFGLPRSLNPNIDGVYYRVSTVISDSSTVDTHSSSLSDIVEKSGLTVNASSFSDAYTDLPVNVRFSIPNFDESKFGTYLSYAQDILKSTLGYLKLNSDYEVEYHLLSAPTSSSVRDENNLLRDNTDIEIDYSDITTKVVAYNPHMDYEEALDAANSPSESSENLKSVYLHGIVNTDRLRHVLDDISSRIDAHIGIKSQRKAKYSFSTATQDIDTEIGDDLTIQNTIVLGTENEQNLKVISVNKSPEKTSIEALDLEGL